MGQHDQRHVMMPAVPTATLIVIQPEFLFELLIVLLDLPTGLGHLYQPAETVGGGQITEEVFDGLGGLPCRWRREMGPFWRAGRGHLCGCAMDFGASPEVLHSGLGCPTATLVAPRQPRPSPRGPQVFSMIFEVRACVNRNLYPVCWASQRAVSILFPKPSRLRFFPRAWDCPPSTISRRARACVIALAAGRHSPPSSDGGVVHLVPPKWPLRPPPLTHLRSRPIDSTCKAGLPWTSTLIRRTP